MCTQLAHIYICIYVAKLLATKSCVQALVRAVANRRAAKPKQTIFIPRKRIHSSVGGKGAPCSQRILLTPTNLCNAFREGSFEPSS